MRDRRRRLSPAILHVDRGRDSRHTTADHRPGDYEPIHACEPFITRNILACIMQPRLNTVQDVSIRLAGQLAEDVQHKDGHNEPNGQEHDLLWGELDKL